MLILVVVAVMTVMEMVLRKVFNIGKREKNRPRYVNNMHKWGEIALIVLFVISYIMVINLDLEWSYLWIAFFFAILQLFRAFMEWKYPIQRGEYIIHLFGAVVLVIFILLVSYTDWLNRFLGF
ncbi:DUF4181 domain-containing protein [Psychrobacillus sp. NEAU-3TGS]|uniref:DUF4181 domain-containing protein n=1 Tax=Psychrobacillus sp. NEAU-3TGS TaxID=2995412 RepID=UPI002495B3E1|nr:DUF4181 domain-containing protein [Psychrobacillus sp. NEAU-3TGS]MDI2585625.1 DUF4181 domain-containing protein [Psychrobacillus sp. NEAU-3TGS]